MANTSATGGFLNVVNHPLSQEQIEALLFPIITNLTGLDESHVFVAYQQTPPAAPKLEEDWVGYYLSMMGADNFPQVYHDPSGEGTDIEVENVHWNWVMEFVGPNSVHLARQLRASIYIEQNRPMELYNNGLAIKYADSLKFFPYVENGKWLKKSYLRIKIDQWCPYRFDVLNLLSAHGRGVTDEGLEIYFDTNNIT